MSARPFALRINHMAISVDAELECHHTSGAGIRRVPIDIPPEEPTIYLCHDQPQHARAS